MKPRIKTPQVSLRKLVPSALTVAAICLGLTAVKFALDHRPTESMALLAGAAILDALDGRAARMLNATFGSMYRDAQHAPRPGQHPGMHRTATVDYALMLQGELVAIMDKDETVLRAGDVLIQRGTNHAWANRSGAPARVAFVLIAGSA